MKIITLCGSTKFKDDFEQINALLTLEGHIVLSVGVYMHSDGMTITPEKKVELDELHLRKIDMCDEIFVVDVNGYIGESTSREIQYALSKYKPINYYSKSPYKCQPEYSEAN